MNKEHYFLYEAVNMIISVVKLDIFNMRLYGDWLGLESQVVIRETAAAAWSD